MMCTFGHSVSVSVFSWLGELVTNPTMMHSQFYRAVSSSLSSVTKAVSPCLLVTVVSCSLTLARLHWWGLIWLKRWKFLPSRTLRPPRDSLLALIRAQLTKLPVTAALLTSDVSWISLSLATVAHSGHWLSIFHWFWVGPRQWWYKLVF